MEKSFFKALIFVVFFLGFSLTAKAIDNYKLYFKYQGSDSTSLNLELSGDDYVSVPLYVNVPANAPINGAIIPWAIGNGLLITVTSPAYNASSGASIFYHINNVPTKNIVIDNSASSSGEVQLATFKVSASNLDVGSSSQLVFYTSRNGYQAVVASNTTSYNITGGATLTITKKAATPVDTVLPGDWDRSGRVEGNDAVNIMRYAMNWTDNVTHYNGETNEWKSKMNINSIDGVNAIDAVLAMRIAMGWN